MKNKIKKITSILLGFLLVIAGACTKKGNNMNTFDVRKGTCEIKVNDLDFSESNGTKTSYDYTTYDNRDFNDYDCGGNEAVVNSSVIKDQWPTGLADPYVLRYNGIYYLYATTSGLTNFGLRAWKSTDLKTWTKCQGEGLPEGYVVSPYGQSKADFGQPTLYTQNAYAPEVYYFNGKFYMYTSPGYAANPRGHYVLVANSPEGPFEYLAGPLDTRIDASILIDDDENVYYLHASNWKISIQRLTNMSEIDLDEDILIDKSDLMGAWTEGPALMKLRGKYYLTYTGLHYQTTAYQVCYAVADSLDTTSIQTVADSFRHGANNPMLLNCDREEGNVGMGHSVNFLGPDLDSYYMSYHCLDTLYEDGMTHRSFNIDRVLVGDDYMAMTGLKTGSIYPNFPRFYQWGLEEGFTKQDGYYFANAETGKRFSVEFNSKGDENTKYVFGYKDGGNYSYVEAKYSEHKINLFDVKNGVETLVGTGELKNDFSENDNHTIRLAYDEGVMYVTFDNMCKITANYEFNSGKVAYKSDKNIEVGYTAISDEANGSSDRKEIKQSETDMPATSFMLENQVEGVNSFKLSGNSKIMTCKGTSSDYVGTKEVYLREKMDFVRYLVNFRNASKYGLELVVNKKCCGNTICVQIDDGENKLVQIPEVGECNDEYVRVLIKDFDISAGVHQIKIQNVGHDVSFCSLSFTRVGDSFTYENSLAGDPNEISGAKIITGDFAEKDGALRVKGNRSFMQFTNDDISDFEVSVDVKLETGIVEPIGLIFREDNYASSEVPGQKFADAYCHIQGYHLKIYSNSVVICRYNYGLVKSYEIARKAILTKTNQFVNFKVEAKGNTFKVYRNDELLIEVIDPIAFQTGAIGIYSCGGSGSYKDLKIKTI